MLQMGYDWVNFDYLVLVMRLTFLLLMAICFVSHANTIYLWQGDNTLQAKILKDGTACDVETNTVFSQDVEKHGQPCPIETSDDKLNEAVDGLRKASQAHISHQSSDTSAYPNDDTWGWVYDVYQDEWSNKKYNTAILVSNDGNVGLSIMYAQSDRAKNNPFVSFYFTWQVDDDYVMHAPFCYDECAIDLKADDNTYPNIAMARNGAGKLLYSKYPKTTVNRIKNAETIKIRVRLLDGGVQTYTFNTSQPLDLKRL